MVFVLNSHHEGNFFSTRQCALTLHKQYYINRFEGDVFKNKNSSLKCDIEFSVFPGLWLSLKKIHDLTSKSL